jgi:hypothetical protein
MMRIYLIFLVTIVIYSCQTSANNPQSTDKQKKIDSLINVIGEKEKVEKKQINGDIANAVVYAKERKDLFKKVTTDEPAYRPVSLGGFTNIHFNLFNDYNYKLDQVILKVHYIKANGIEVHSETIIETDMAPNSHRNISAPDYTIAGRMLIVTIESVLCKAIDLCYYGNGDSVALNDPYKCRE